MNKNVTIAQASLRRADLRRLLREDEEIATELLNQMGGEPPHNCILLERLRFGPPSCWKAWQPQQGLVVVRFWHEAGDWRRIDPALRCSFLHPAIIVLLRWGETWEVHPWIAGKILGPDPLTADQYTVLAEAIDVLHQHGQAHGDLTPSNIIIGAKDQRPYIIDGGEFCAGTQGWVPQYAHTPQQRDLFALQQLRQRVRE